MPKAKGHRNLGYDEKRRDLIVLARQRLARRDLKYPSLREIAAACEVTMPTLRHYFGNREDIITAILEQAHAQGRRFMAAMEIPSGPFEDSVREGIGSMLAGFRVALGDIFAIGLSEGLRQSNLADRFLELVLEPTVQAATARLQAHIEKGEMRRCDARVAALSLVSPVVITMLHQRELAGAQRWPMSIEVFAVEHAKAFVRAYRSGD